MVVCEFFANAPNGNPGYMVFIGGKQVKYDVVTINQLLWLPYNPSDPNEVKYMMNKANMEEVSRAICKSGGTQWTIVRDEHAHFPSKDLQ